MAALIRYYFGGDPYRLSARNFVLLYREAELLLSEFKPIQKLL